VKKTAESLIPVQKVIVAFCQPTIERDCERILQTVTSIRNILTAPRQETRFFAPESKASIPFLCAACQDMSF
jgi:hypothetical protein